MEKIELLAPAGDLEKLKIDVLYGADAVYIGGKQFSLRSAASNFSYEEIEEGVKFAHSRNCKVYVALNVYLNDGDEEELDVYVGNIKKFSALPGASSDNYAVRITDVIREEQ